MEDPKETLKQLLEKTKNLSINLSELDAIQKNFNTKLINKKIIKIFVSIAVIYVLLDVVNFKDSCLVAMPDELRKAFRLPTTCDFCRNVKSVPRVSNIDPDDFEKNFAYNGGPVIVTDATTNWTALEVFDYWYFQEVYDNQSSSNERWNCQFFPYKSGLHSLEEALNLPEEQVNFEKGTKPWYFGWSNCNREVAEILREHYGRPYFLPRTSELNIIDWIFIGGPGLGAHLHVDNVRLPSWQAQLKGEKEWFLAPPPECYFECHFFSTVVKTGDIIVLDTNKWYHKTNVLSGEMSITIGAEYD